jgi:hypothetical protein
MLLYTDLATHSKRMTSNPSAYAINKRVIVLSEPSAVLKVSGCTGGVLRNRVLTDRGD